MTVHRTACFLAPHTDIIIFQSIFSRPVRCVVAEISSVNSVDVRRFRPTILIETADDGVFPEDAWVGHTIQVGTTTLRAEEKTKRCGVTFLSQPGLDDDPDILRNIVRHNRRHLGVYCSVALQGIIQVGDQLTFLDDG